MKGMILQVADKNNSVDKEALKAQKKAEKEALKAKKERIKQSKPKKSEEGNIFVRMGKAIKKFFKDFRGTCKKVIWPDRKTVLKNTLVVFLTVLIAGIGIWIADFAFSRGIRGVQSAIVNAAQEDESGEDSQSAESTSESADTGAVSEEDSTN